MFFYSVNKIELAYPWIFDLIFFFPWEAENDLFDSATENTFLKIQ